MCARRHLMGLSPNACKYFFLTSPPHAVMQVWGAFWRWRTRRWQALSKVTLRGSSMVETQRYRCGGQETLCTRNASFYRLVKAGLMDFLEAMWTHTQQQHWSLNHDTHNNKCCKDIEKGAWENVTQACNSKIFNCAWLDIICAGSFQCYAWN